MRIAIVNDYPLVVAGVHQMLRGYADRVTVAELDTDTDVRQPVDVALFDTFGAAKFDASEVQSMIDDLEVGAVLLYTWDCSGQTLQRAKEAGVDGVVSKRVGPGELVEAIEAASRADGFIVRVATLTQLAEARSGSVDHHEWLTSLDGLTMREAEVVALICKGFSNAEIADRLNVSPNSVKSYIRGAYRKMGVNTRAQAVAWGIRKNLLPGVSHREPRVS